MSDQPSIRFQDFKNESHKKSFVFWLALGLLLLGIDQLVKFLTFRYTAIFPKTGMLKIIAYKNFDFAFSLKLSTFVMYLIYVVALILLAEFIRRKFWNVTIHERAGLVLVLAGGLANFFERIVLGYVRDFLLLPGGGIINLADVYIVLGLLLLLFGHRLSSTKTYYDSKNSDRDSHRP